MCVKRLKICKWKAGRLVWSRGFLRAFPKDLNRGEKRFARLTKALIQEKRYEDLDRAAADDSYRAELYRELNITLV